MSTQISLCIQHRLIRDGTFCLNSIFIQKFVSLDRQADLGTDSIVNPVYRQTDRQIDRGNQQSYGQRQTDRQTDRQTYGTNRRTKTDRPAKRTMIRD